MARPSRPPSPAGSASSMVLTCDVEPLSTRTILLLSRSLMRKVPSLRVTRPQGASRSVTISRARGSPRDRAALGVGLLGPGLLGSGFDGGAEVAGVDPAVRVSGLGSLSALVQPATRSSAPQAAAKEERLTRCLSGIGVAVTTTVSPVCAREVSRPEVGRVQDLDRLRFSDQLDLCDAGPA